MISALDIAIYVIGKYWKVGQPITNLKLQKIMYYIQGYSFRLLRGELYSEKIYRWPYGPVVPEVYFYFNEYRNNSLPEPSYDQFQDAIDAIKSDKIALEIIDRIIEASYSLSAAQMVAKTHGEAPWREAKDGGIIGRGIIADYFNFHDPLRVDI